MAKILITGVSGHIGANLVRMLLAEGHEVWGLVHSDKRGVFGLGVKVVKGDVLDVEFLKKSFKGIDIVFHLAAFVSVSRKDEKKIMQINIEGTKNVIDACLSTGVKKLVHFGSVHGFVPGKEGEVVDETFPLAVSHEFSPYTRSKAESMKAVLDAVSNLNLDATVLCPSAVIGPFDFKPSLLGKALIDMAEGRLFALVKGGYNFVDVRDVAKAAISAAFLEKTRGKMYILSGYNHLIEEIFDMVQKFVYVKKPKLIFSPILLKPILPVLTSGFIKKSFPITPETVDILRNNTRFSNIMAKRELSFKISSITKAVGDALLWFRKNGMLNRAKFKEEK